MSAETDTARCGIHSKGTLFSSFSAFSYTFVVLRLNWGPWKFLARTVELNSNPRPRFTYIYYTYFLTLYVVVCMHVCLPGHCVRVREQVGESFVAFSPGEAQGLNPGHLTKWQTPLSAEPSHLLLFLCMHMCVLTSTHLLCVCGGQDNSGAGACFLPCLRQGFSQLCSQAGATGV